MKKKLVGVLVGILTLALSMSAFATMEFDKVKFSGDVTFSVSSETPAGLLTGSSKSELKVEVLSKSGDSWSASSDGWIKYAADSFAFELNKALDYKLYDLDANIPKNPGVKLTAGPATLVLNNQEYPTGSVAYSYGGGLSFSTDGLTLGVMANSTPVATEAYYGTSFTPGYNLESLAAFTSEEIKTLKAFLLFSSFKELIYSRIDSSEGHCIFSLIFLKFRGDLMSVPSRSKITPFTTSPLNLSLIIF